MRYLNFSVSGRSKQTNIHTRAQCSQASVGLAQARPNDNPFGVQGILATCQGNVCKCRTDIIYMLFSLT